MTQWFYSDGGPAHGPLDAHTLAAEFRAGRLQLQHLVWREGLPQWQPLSSCLGELGLWGAVPPPPLPPARPIAAAPRRGLSGCALAAIIAVACMVPVAAILAAIAVPAYQNYTARASVAQALSGASPAKLQLQMAMIGRPPGQCPRNGEGPLGTPQSYATQGLARVTAGPLATGGCGLELVLRQPRQARLDGKRLWLELEPGLGGWRCSAELPDRYLPASCRNRPH